ncbi:MAG: type I-E CRISPR-associated protein Cas6/Cse3/CasE [Deltaproteobacteria bacterium]|nr:type I-E CRISPR-associated protein Cas6/Cse3/CasE [Deltaproteobacteria bacterium]
MSLYLSRLLLNPRSRQVMSEMAHPYEMHRTLMRAFPKATEDAKSKARDEFGVLFRAEADDRRGAVKVFAQSRMEPNWSFLDRLNDYLCTDGETPEYEYKDILPAYRRIQDGQVLSFRLRANPTKRIAKQDDVMKGKRVELRREEEQIDWLIRKGQGREKGVPGGFDLLMKRVECMNGQAPLAPCVKVSCEGKQTGRKRDVVGGHSTTHLAVLFDGLLRVTDTNAFLDTIIRGIGPGKAFGFGLLSLAPVSASRSEDTR